MADIAVFIRDFMREHRLTAKKLAALIGLRSAAALQQLAAGKGDGYNFYDPEAIVITSCDRESRFVKEDTSCALENMFLYAHSVDIGSVWINQPSVVCDDKAVREILSSFGIPETHVLGGMAALGYPAEMQEKDLTRKCKMNFVD